MDEGVELLEEAGAVFVGEGGGAAGHEAVFAELGGDFAVGKCAADGVFGEEVAFGVEYAGAFFEALRGEGNVGGDDDVAGGGALGDPVVGFVEAVAHQDEFDAGVVGGAHPGVCHEGDGDGVAFCNAVGFVFDGAGICVYVDVGHGGKCP